MKILYFHCLIFVEEAEDQIHLLFCFHFHFVCVHFHFFCDYDVRYIANEEVAGRSGHARGKLRCIVRPPPSIPTPTISRQLTIK